ncbi:hypothetical protein M514_09390 [Trichuris suis]|uniref:Uncharacterized protein n=1 Tax=Trichuris suis TaxID=68888 RepID=A0A085LXJ7_9BILA|nr:hypothetical protein M513_09390 [Trichuris suis]KFD62039.1 hypothetical protein M514_09390 [Trichuris suis]
MGGIAPSYLNGPNAPERAAQGGNQMAACLYSRDKVAANYSGPSLSADLTQRGLSQENNDIIFSRD